MNSVSMMKWYARGLIATSTVMFLGWVLVCYLDRPLHQKMALFAGCLVSGFIGAMVYAESE